MEVKGHTKRVIQAPGYRIHPKYDLKYLRKRRESGNERHVDHELPLTSMIDMLSLLVIFLIMNYSATGEVFFINRDIKIPNAFHGVAMSSKPLISITENFVMLDAEKVGENPLHIEEKDKELPKLRLALQKIKRFHDQAHPGVPFEGGVNIQADQATPVIYIKRVMNTLLMEGWTAINFVVRRPEQQNVAAHD